MRNMIAKGTQSGCADPDLWRVNLLGWNLRERERERAFSLQLVDQSSPEFFQHCFWREGSVMCSMDVKDAFLTVVQERPTLVHTTDAGRNRRSFSLGRVLPGQRDGSLQWYKSITSFLKKHLALEEHAPYPCILKHESCVVMIHVDDLLVVGRRKFVPFHQR